MKDLEGKTAFVTGAASGIGLATTTALAQAGVKVMMCDIEQEALDAAIAELRKTNADVEGVVADVSLKEQLQAAADATIEKYGKVHILFNNAGVGGGGSYDTWSQSGWDWTMAVNVMGVVYGVEIFGPLIESHGEGGHIVSTASVAGLMSMSSAPYFVSKYGVVALSEGLRVELEPRGIGVSVLCPGIIRTRILESGRNLQSRYGGDVDELFDPNDPESEAAADFRARLEAGIDPSYVGELVREGIEKNWDYIVTDMEFEPIIRARFENIMAAYERIKDRDPRR
ncbi:MAG: SDR family NAD(P)-dependent oxidoreductase [Alphaproteobacteria bacterium]|nr:SDR family NAD(P)-dependent oxidoreductase [Alphaproteobacteria bacterium]